MEDIKKRALALSDSRNRRDWGMSIVIRNETKDGADYREKFLVFNPCSSICLERHEGYSEIWVADGSFEYYLEADNGKLQKYHAAENEKICIPVGKKHKIINPNSKTLHIFETQTGTIRDDDKAQFFEEDKHVC